MKPVLVLLLVSGCLCSQNHSCVGTSTTVTVCQPDACALLSEVITMREKLSATSQTQSTLQEKLLGLIEKVATVEANMQNYKNQVEQLSKKNQALEDRMKELADKPKIAFAVALGSSMGPVSQHTTVKYTKIFSNFNSNYNPATGVFTAPTRGVYYFTYSMYNNDIGQSNSVLALMRNNEQIVRTWDAAGSGDNNDSATNGAVLELQAGDAVYVRLFERRQIHDDNGNYNTFRGFLLFTL